MKLVQMSCIVLICADSVCVCLVKYTTGIMSFGLLFQKQHKHNDLIQAGSQPFDNRGSFSSDCGVPNGCPGKILIIKIIMIDGVTLWSKLESTYSILLILLNRWMICNMLCICVFNVLMFFLLYIVSLSVYLFHCATISW